MTDSMPTDSPPTRVRVTLTFCKSSVNFPQVKKKNIYLLSSLLFRLGQIIREPPVMMVDPNPIVVEHLRELHELEDQPRIPQDDMTYLEEEDEAMQDVVDEDEDGAQIVDEGKSIIFFLNKLFIIKK